VDPNLITTTQAAVDPVFMFIFGACLVLLVGITAVMVWFTFRYRRSREPEPTSQAEGNLWLEIVWTVFPTILVMAMFYYGWAGYLALRNVPKGALEVTATARMWSWSFAYPNGRISTKLYVPAGKPVKVDLVSTDVLHGFYLPAFRVKRDVVPGMKNYAWFVAIKPGSYDLFCSQYCGTGHSAMITTVEALPEAEFTAWLNRREQGVAEHLGKELLQKHGCLGCHSLDGTKGVGPTFKGLYRSTIKVLVEGKPVAVTVDEAYLSESIVKPAAKIVEGFQPLMPTYPDLSAEDVKALVEFIEEIR
jgi:cytochrome c oxidase subunit 2